MKRNLLPILLFFLTLGNLKASVKIDSLSTSSDTSYLQKNFVTANFFSPSISFEHRVGKNSTLYISSGLALSGSFNINSETGSSSSYSLNPFVELNFRNYYNFEKRLQKNKNIKYNSGNYIGGSVSYIGEAVVGADDYDYKVFTFGPVWGFQRTYNSRFYLDLNLGLGYYNIKYQDLFAYYNGSNLVEQRMPAESKGVTLIGNFRLGFYLGKK